LIIPYCLVTPESEECTLTMQRQHTSFTKLKHYSVWNDLHAKGGRKHLMPKIHRSMSGPKELKSNRERLMKRVTKKDKTKMSPYFCSKKGRTTTKGYAKQHEKAKSTTTKKLAHKAMRRHWCIWCIAVLGYSAVCCNSCVHRIGENTTQIRGKGTSSIPHQRTVDISRAFIILSEYFSIVRVC
jgi:hypothetical protein